MQEFHPYVFQIFAQLVSRNRSLEDIMTVESRTIMKKSINSKN